jgi:hypothetical protein
VCRVPRRLLVPAMLALLAGCGGTPAPAPAPAPSTVGGASLVEVQVGGSPAYLQVLDLAKVRLDQVTGDRDGGRAPGPGAYYPGKDSPAFHRISPALMQRSCRDRYGARAVSAVNAQFFEDYQPGTPLSFPVKASGTVLTGGSSPYGPVPAPKVGYYRTVTLDALSWDGHGVTIAPYHPDTGAPLAGPVPDAIVTYRYADHPSYVLDHDPPNRYQLAGALDATRLAILTVTHASLAEGAQVLVRQGVHGDILTFDGGVSTYLWTAARGDLVKVTNNDGMLPHYLCAHAP